VGVDFEILKAAERANKLRIDRFLEKVHQALRVMKGTRVAIPRPRIHFRLQGRH
jgi:UDP-glucose 6-dehydrogenase